MDVARCPEPNGKGGYGGEGPDVDAAERRAHAGMRLRADHRDARGDEEADEEAPDRHAAEDHEVGVVQTGLR